MEGNTQDSVGHVVQHVANKNAILIILIYSRILTKGFEKVSPCRSSITSFPDAPNPRKNLPPDMLSKLMAAMAKFAGLRANTGTMLVPTLMFLVNFILIMYLQ